VLFSIIAVDPGSIFFGISKFNGKEVEEVLDWHFKGKDIKIRYQEIALKLGRYLLENKADYYAVETTWFSSWAKNAQSAIKISIVRGIVIGAIFSSNIDAKLIDISPQETRSCFNLPRNATKEDIHNMLEREYGQIDAKEDGKDSIALGVAAYYKIKRSLITQTKFI
jgi:Holliday junction resolvasome RuvABC endonuclease subunit